MYLAASHYSTPDVEYYSGGSLLTLNIYKTQTLSKESVTKIALKQSIDLIDETRKTIRQTYPNLYSD